MPKDKENKNGNIMDPDRTEQEHTMLKYLMDNTPDSIYFKDMESRFIGISESLARKFGATDKKSTLGKRDFDFFDKKHAQKAFDDEQKIMETGTALTNIDEEEIWPDGRETWASSSKMPLRDDEGNIIGIFGISRDITDRKLVEEELRQANMRCSSALTRLRQAEQQIIQQERLSAIGQIASGVAHDINNALMPIVGFSEFLLNHPEVLDDTDDTLNIVKDIFNAAENTKHVVARMRDFYRPYDEIEHQPIILKDVIDSAMALTAPKWKEEAHAQGIDVQIHQEIDNIPPVSGIESELQSAVTNLLLNAVDAMPKGGRITVRVYTEEDRIALDIVDTGNGMPEEVKQRCFEPFFTTKEQAGTGMGLAIVHGIIRRHFGTLKIETAPGKGTSMCIRLRPYVSKQDGQETVIKYKTLHNLNVLIIDDEIWSSNVLKRYLASDNHTVSSSLLGQEGYKSFCKDDFDIAIIDRALPDMSGDSLARRMKSEKPDIPVLMLTGFGQIMKESGEVPEGVDLVVGKPITQQELQHAIAKVMAEKNHPDTKKE